MALPITTTTIAVSRPNEEADYYEPTTLTAIASGVPAHISSPGGGEQVIGGEQSNTAFRLSCELADITHTDQVTDETTNTVYQVVWVQPRVGLGLDHLEAELRLVEGNSNV